MKSPTLCLPSRFQGATALNCLCIVRRALGTIAIWRGSWISESGSVRVSIKTVDPQYDKPKMMKNNKHPTPRQTGFISFFFSSLLKNVERDIVDYLRVRPAWSKA